MKQINSDVMLSNVIDLFLFQLYHIITTTRKTFKNIV